MHPRIVIAREEARLDSRVAQPTAICADPVCSFSVPFFRRNLLRLNCAEVDDSSRAFLGTFDGRKQHPFSELVY